MTRLIIFGLISSLAWGVLAPSQTLAQDGGQPVQPAGVRIDASGVLRMQFFSDPTGRLGRQRINEMRAELDADVARRSKLRKISLTRLEAVIAERLATGGGLTEDMRNLVGLTRLQYIFFYPDTNDIVIAGPAEGYGTDLSGRVIGLQTGQAVLLLEDLITALRSFPPHGEATPVISCSIDPTAEGLARILFSPRTATFSGPMASGGQAFAQTWQRLQKSSTW